MIAIDGRCHCGEIRYQAEVDPERVTICHCTDCQALTGSPFRVSVPVDPRRLRVEGEPRIYIKPADSGRRRLQHFCQSCGAPLFTSGEGADVDRWSIRWGGIRQRDQLTPKRQIWRRSAPDWICAFETVPAEMTE